MALPRLAALLAQTTAGHGADHPELHELSRAFARYSSFVNDHIVKEERLIFPLLRRLGAAPAPDESLAGRLSEAIGALERTNDEARAALARMRSLTCGFVPPADAGPGYRTLLAGLAELETDMEYHARKERRLLFAEVLVTVPGGGRV
jgi:regulator of cell morphogenesis and NO signaling